MTAEMVRWSERKIGGVEVEREGASKEWNERRKEGWKDKGRQGKEERGEGRGRGYEMVRTRKIGVGKSWG